MKSFTAVDFETANSNRNSACAIGIVTVENGEIVDEFSALIQPPNNEYAWYNTHRVHGIGAEHTKNVPFFDGVYPEIKKRLYGRTIVAHDERFDREVMRNTMADFGIDYSDLNVADKWECTFKLYGKSLNKCCEANDIELDHHNALSDARGCALLYLIHDNQ